MHITNAMKVKYNPVLCVTLAVGFFFFFSNNSAIAATLGIDAGTVSLSPGETTTLRVLMNTQGVAVNNAEAKLAFPNDIIEVISINKNNSVMTLWVEDPSFSNSAGIVTFNGGVPTPGYIGTQGQILSIAVRARKVGQAELIFSNSAIRANDGFGTNVLTSQRGIILTVVDKTTSLPPSLQDPAGTSAGTIDLALKSSSHPDQTKWYANNIPEFSWTLPDGALEVRTLIGKNPTATPSVSYIPPISEKKIDELADGVYYFSLQVRTAEGWSDIARYRVNIDVVPPNPFSITFPHGNIGWDPQPVIYFNTKDNESGISHYDIKIGEEGKPSKTGPMAESNPYVLPSQLPGTYTLLVTAIDNAGNMRNTTAEITVEAIDEPVITYYSEVLDEGDILKIKGATYANSDVTLYVREGEELVSEEYTRSNILGDFTVIVEKKLDAGEYTFTARVKDVRGAQSMETSPLMVTVRSDFSTGIVSLVLKYLSVAILLLLALGGIGWAGLWLWFRIPRTVAHMRKRAREAETVSERAFKILREGVVRHITQLKNTKRKLTKEEIEFLEEFEDKLGEAEEIIGKEIKNISKS